MRNGMIVVGLCIGLAGCVSSGKYKALEAESVAQRQSLAVSLVDSQKETAAAKKETAAARQEFENASLAWQGKLDESQGETKAAKEEIAGLKSRISTLEASNKDLRESMEAKEGALSKKVSQLSGEKDALAQKLSQSVSEQAAFKAAKEKEIAALRRGLDAAMAERAALEKAKESDLAKAREGFDALAAGLKAEIAAGAIKLTELEGKLTMNMVDRILFDSGESDVKTAGRKVLDRIAQAISGMKDKNVNIEGHTDNVPIGGELKQKFPTNWELSTARATAVARYLQEKGHIDPDRLVATGYGEFHPVASNADPKDRALNRRIEIVLVPKK